MEGCRTRSRKRKLGEIEARPNPKSAAEDQDPLLPGADGVAGDRISQLPDGVLGDIITLLPTKEGARTQILASRWRHLWRAAPLNLDHLWLCRDRTDLDAVVSRILSAHPGPARRLCLPVYHLVGDRAATANAWLRSPALDNLQELELCSFDGRLPFPPSTRQLPPPAAAFRFSETLRVATIGECQLPDTTAQALQFPNLKKLELKRVSVSESSLHAMIAACPALECLLIHTCSGFHCLRINSTSLRSIDCQAGSSWFEIEKLVIENAPCLERFIQVDSRYLDTSVVSAPKLETLGCFSSSSSYGSTRLAFDDSVVIKGLRVESLTTAVRTVKILSVAMYDLSLDVVIGLIRCFPCLEKFYIESEGPGKTNLWRRKHKYLIRSLDISLKTIVLSYYGGNKSHVDFATFFVLNARALELMTLQVNQENYNEDFFGRQRKMLQLDSKASRGAQFHFIPYDSHRYNMGCYNMDFCLQDLDLADPFDRKDPNEFYALL